METEENINKIVELYSHQYCLLEHDLLYIVKYIPINKININSVSLDFASIILSGASLFENIFEMIFEIQYLEYTKNHTKNPNFKTRFDSFLMNMLKTNLRLNKEIRFYFYNLIIYNKKKNLSLSDKLEIDPFNRQNDIKSGQWNLDWWTLYNKIKHERNIKNIEKATLNNVLKCLAACFVSLYILICLSRKTKDFFYTSLDKVYLLKNLVIVGQSINEENLSRATILNLPAREVVSTMTAKKPFIESEIFDEDFYWKSSEIKNIESINKSVN